MPAVIVLKTTLQLDPGDRVQLPNKQVRTVARVDETTMRNARGKPIYTVRYAEGQTESWGPANTAIAKTRWRVLGSAPAEDEDEQGDGGEGAEHDEYWVGEVHG